MKNKYDIRRSAPLAALMVIFSIQTTEAQEFEGAYGAIEGGIGILKIDGVTIAGPFDEVENSGLIGGVIGYRAPVADDSPIVLGLEGLVDFYTNGSNLRYGAYGIAGYRVGETGLAYVRLGYSWLDDVATGIGSGLDGLTYGGGYEFRLRERMNLRLDYRRIDYGGVNVPDNVLDFDGHEITAGVVFNF